MKRVLLSSLVGVSMVCISVNGWAAKSVNNNQLAAQMRRVSMQMHTLQNEVRSLRAQVRHLKHSRGGSSSQHHIPVPKRHHRRGHHAYAAHSNILGHPVTVTTTPIIGAKSAYNASDLLREVSSMNEDMHLLKERQKVEHYLNARNDSLSNRGIVEVSGGIEAQGVSNHGYAGVSDSNISLSSAELDINALVSRWANTFFSIDYDSSPASTGSRVPNSRLYLKRGFLTIGNLDVTPWYLTVGQKYAPFGRYAGGMATSPETLSMARILARVAELGFTKGGFYGSVYAFRGNQTTASGRSVMQSGVNLGLKDSGHWDVGVGAVSNIADSQGMQDNGLPNIGGAMTIAANQFRGFAETGSVASINTNMLRHRVAGGDVHAEATCGPVSLIGEYISALSHFNGNDLSYNGSAAQPASGHLEGIYQWHMWGKPLSLGLAYGRTWQALALNLPKISYTAYLTASIWKDTVETLEFRHDVNYRAMATGAGAGVAIVGAGRSRNLITLQLGAYF